MIYIPFLFPYFLITIFPLSLFLFSYHNFPLSHFSRSRFHAEKSRYHIHFSLTFPNEQYFLHLSSLHHFRRFLLISSHDRLTHIKRQDRHTGTDVHIHTHPHPRTHTNTQTRIQRHTCTVISPVNTCSFFLCL